MMLIFKRNYTYLSNLVLFKLETEDTVSDLGITDNDKVAFIQNDAIWKFNFDQFCWKKYARLNIHSKFYRYSNQLEFDIITYY